MGVDGDVREVTPADRNLTDAKLPKQAGFIAGSRAVDSLERMITSIESLFHPSNNGPWSLTVCHSLLFMQTLVLIYPQLTTFVQRLSSEFTKRWKEEEQDTCRTPVVS